LNTILDTKPSQSLTFVCFHLNCIRRSCYCPLFYNLISNMLQTKGRELIDYRIYLCTEIVLSHHLLLKHFCKPIQQSTFTSKNNQFILLFKLLNIQQSASCGFNREESTILSFCNNLRRTHWTHQIHSQQISNNTSYISF
jgi:hypothetical protein